DVYPSARLWLAACGCRQDVLIHACPRPRAMLLLFLLLVPFIGSVIAALMSANARNRESWLAGGVAMFGLLVTLYLYAQTGSGEAVRFHATWLPAYGLDFTLRLDGLAWLFAMLIQGIGVLVVIYARYYMSPDDPVPRFFSFLLAFMRSEERRVGKECRSRWAS